MCEKESDPERERYQETQRERPKDRETQRERERPKDQIVRNREVREIPIA